MLFVDVGLASSGTVNHRSCLEIDEEGICLDFLNSAAWLVVHAAVGVSIVVLGSGRLNGDS